MERIIDLGLMQLIAVYALGFIIIGLIKLTRLAKEKLVLWAYLRMSFQLVLIGFILKYVFNNADPFLTIVIIIIMESFAIYNVYKRVGFKLTKQFKILIAFSFLIGTAINIALFIFLIIRLSPWFKPCYFIPISGMLIGNSMTGITLAIKNLIRDFREKRDIIENALMLGATPRMACESIIKNSFDSAILPTINSMLGMGVVFLPGMMTGQILAGVTPIIAIKYQIAIMFGILGSVSFTVIIFIYLSYKNFFNRESQLI